MTGLLLIWSYLLGGSFIASLSLLVLIFYLTGRLIKNPASLKGVFIFFVSLGWLCVGGILIWAGIVTAILP